MEQPQEPIHRNVVCLSHMDPELQKWCKDEAERRHQANPKKPYGIWMIVDEALRDFKKKCEETTPVTAG